MDLTIGEKTTTSLSHFNGLDLVTDQLRFHGLFFKQGIKKKKKKKTNLPVQFVSDGAGFHTEQTARS